MLKIKNRFLNDSLGKKFIAIFILLASTFVFTILKADAQVTLGYLSVGRNNHILVVDFSTDKVIGKIYGGEAPAWIRATYDGKEVWTLNWRTMTTTVIHTEKNEVRIRGISNPIFAHDNRRYFVVSSDAGAIFEVDYIARELLSQTPVLIKDYWRGALTPDDRYLYITQMNIAGFVDPNAPKVTYDSIAVYDAQEKRLVKNVKVGLNPHDVQIIPNGRYAIVANKTTDDISIIDTKSMENVLTVKVGKLCRAILSRPDGKQIVVTTDGREGRYEVEAEEEINGEIYSYWTDFGDKPKVEFHKMLKTGGFPEFGGFTPDGKKLILLKRGKAPEVLILEPNTLAVKNRIPTASGAIEVAFASVPEEVRDRMIKEGPPNRKFLSEVITKAKTQGSEFQDAVLTELVEQYNIQAEGSSEKSGEPKRFEQKVYFQSPALLKVEMSGEKASIWKDGILMSEKGQRHRIPEVEQNLQYLVFTLYSSTLEEFLYQLTGDIQGKPEAHRLSIAADVMHTKKVDGREVYVIGASEGDTTSTQIWIDEESLVITYLLESIPFARVQREIRFSDYRKVDGKFMIPFKAEVYVNGKLESRREVKEARFNIGLRDELFRPQSAGKESVRFVWKKIEVEGQGPFADREFTSVVYDSKRNRLILFGGGLHGRNYNDIWAVDLDKNTWSRIEAIGRPEEIPEPRAMHSAVYVPESDRMVVFGSDGTGLMFADYNVYSFDFKTGRWSVIKAQGEHHPRMVNTSMLYLGDERILIFGGGLTPFGNLHGAGSINQVTMFDLRTGQWTKIEAKGDTPPPITNSSVALDRKKHRAIMFMGSTFTDRQTYLSEIYTLDLRSWTWTKLQTKNPPSARGYVGHAFLEDLNRFVIFGGWDGNWQRQSALSETYSLNLNTFEWEKLEFAGPDPSPRAPFTAASDGKRMFIFGGWSGVPRAGSLYNDVWQLIYEK